MEDKYKGCLVCSKAGHDRGEVFLVTGEEGNTVFLADGRGRGADTPKRKNIKHLALIRRGYPPELRDRVRRGELPDDDEIRRVIKDYKRFCSNQEEVNV